ncbi:CYTH domain-containing protein [Actinomadura sp. LD22]|uniref:CYTH domain-containing protein n=1 Tax=Actinomadura physcomitrii TaxID=2650748 RepID=A0A6I4MDV4_9ACTN|nr:CYTH domain-containing protein [Actinomadura physcomitrii]MWA02715.1 CYTH domain-containing protein [Actinomadura physcomitrii]
MEAQEIEVKYRVIEQDALLRALADHGVSLSAPVLQEDQAYAPVWWDYGKPKTGVPFGRLRTVQGTHLFTVKTPQDNEMACLEAETVVNDAEQMHEALLQMGFRPTVQIVKARRTGRAGRWSLCLDEVEDVGPFLEIETVTAADEPGLAVQAQLDAWATGLGVKLERVTDTYDSLVRLAQQHST